MDEAYTIHTSIIIIGAGFSGLGMGIALRKAGNKDFLILEKADDIGGTWRENTYPGCACDVPSHMYSYSFEPHPRWSKMWAEHDEIFQYLKNCTSKYDLNRNITFNSPVVKCFWDTTKKLWHIFTAGGKEYTAQYVIMGVGALHIPNIPSFPGKENFTGTSFHSAHWNHDFNPRNKKIAVIGSGASAIQFIPRISQQARELQLYQRNPAWVIPRPDARIPSSIQNLFQKIPLSRRLFRYLMYWIAEAVALGLNGHSNLLKPLEKMARRYIRREISDPVLQDKLTPSYTIGCKRILASDNYYQALRAPHVEVITTEIAEFTEKGIIDRSGIERTVDAVIYATGFRVANSLGSINIIGPGHKNLMQIWKEKGIQTYLGIVTSGMPNLFFLLGPNTGLGHNSVVFMIEQQIRYIMRLIKLSHNRGSQTIEVRKKSQQEFNSDIHRKLAQSVWSTGGCHSWYLDSQGVNRALWPGFSWQYWLRTRTVNAHDYEFTA